jgi:topoisomerase-4 subunit A
VRIVLVPKSRSVDPGILMESLFKLTELESRFPLNMNVLSRGKVPNVLSLKSVIKEWLEHRKEVLVRRSRHRLAQIEKRLELLGGYLIAYLNIDEVIRIIRFEDEPKKRLMERFELTEVQVEAILNMRLRALAKLEEIEIRKEHDQLSAEKAQIEKLLASEELQWQVLTRDIREIRDTFGPDTDLGKRRTTFADAPSVDVADIQQAMIEREPVTVVLSEKGWIRAMKGHVQDLATLAFKEGDRLKTAFHAETTDKVILFTTAGKFFTLEASKLPGGRGHGEPVRIMMDMDSDSDIIAAFRHQSSRRLIVASNTGNGFLVPEAEVVANTRKGRQVVNVEMPVEARLCVFVGEGDDHIAVVGENRKLLVFAMAQLPEMTRGKGVRLQKYKDGGILDAKTFKLAEGLSWTDSAGRIFVKSADELAEWIGDRASAGRMVPKGFPRSGKFHGQG